jgi:general secretion pathway protein H
MPTSAIGNRFAARDAGVSLVETLSALAIIALVASVVLLAAPGPDRTTRDAAERLAARLAAASEESIVRNRPVALVVTNEGYGFARLEENGWVQIEAASPLTFRAWPEGVTYRVDSASTDSVQREAGRVVRFDAMGGATPTRIVLSGAGARFRVEIDGQGAVHVAEQE